VRVIERMLAASGTRRKQGENSAAPRLVDHLQGRERRVSDDWQLRTWL